MATPKKQGHTLSVMQVVLTNQEGKEVATGTFTFFMSQPEKEYFPLFFVFFLDNLARQW